uniref:Globin family profile domain-containing protein n=1 Tax=Chromera velia CCMP2878 TaxID=1169474 RepID=A0A0G4HUD3_9ALVE|eukprot:Cvel_8599.t1-p1 / transcript=Cvel_8599.t1 / gene=Cvel_8599 / organism=Chromera_velia_CCMP2878 / gene_product=hypothetical protein / transcript_product=hypothetical protein / location=Cvel_scaffold477:43747-62441(+) / protein_length=955 / sequence_SO=supercontig / SO=protein_coding / is_pseudo=false
MSSMGDNRSESRNSDMVPGDLSEVDDMDRREEEPQETRRLLSPIPVGEKATQNQNDESQRPQGRRASVDQSPRESPPEVNIRGMKSRGSMESMPVREDSNKYDEVALGENQGEVIPEEEKKRMMTESLQRCLRAGDKKENIGTLAPSTAAGIGESLGRDVKGQGALADDLCALLTWLVEAVQDISKLRGVVDCLGVPFDHLFKSYGQVPDLVKSVEAAVLRARSAQQAGEANPAEFFLSEEMKAKAQHMEKPEGQEEKAEAENADNAPPGIDLLSAEDDEPNKCWSWLCGKKKKRPTGAESVLSTGSLTKKEQKKALALKLQSAYVPPKEVTAAVLDEFWNEVSEAPTIGQVFMKHKDLYYEVIHAVIARMVAYIDSPWSIWTDDPELALRHVIFGVTPADLRLFCRIYLQSLQKIAREEWLPQYQHAWTKFFNIAAAGLAQFIVAGLDPVTRSLITGSLSDLQGALMGKARGLRAKCCCEVNKSGVYCGREMFWAVYGKHIVPLLCTEAPDLLQVFLDGHIWTSDLVIEGTRKTVLYVKELWGDLSAQIPETELSTEKGNLYDRPSDFPLSHLVLLGRGRIADHPVISWIVETKWKVFARGVFVLRQSLFAGIALFSSFGYVWLARGNAYVSFAFRCAALACSLLVLYLEVNTCLRQMENGFVKGRLPYHMTLAWTWAGWTVIVMNFAAFSEELAYGGLDYLLANKGFITIAFASALRIVSGRMIKHFDGTEASVLSTIGLLVGSYRVDFETEVALSRAIIVADIENSFTRGRLHRLNEKYMKDVFEEKLYFNNELEISPQGGVTVEMPPAFKSPSLEVDGHNDRRQIYDSEEGPEVPWPKETANEKELAGDSDGANSDASREMKMVCDSISSVEKAMKSLSTLMAKISRTLKSSGLQEHGDGTSMGASNTVGTNGDAPSTFAGTKMRKKSKETDNQTDRKMQPHLPQSRRVSS